MPRGKLRPTLAEVKALLTEDRDFLRPLVQAVLQELLEAEMTEALGAEKGERTATRIGYRSGYYDRTLVSRVGKLELRVPQDRHGQFSTELFERYQRSEKALVAALAEMYVQGVSTRKVKTITEELCGHSFSASAISAINVKLDEGLAEFAGRRLDDPYPYLIVDARYERVREAGVIRSQAVLLAIGIGWDGRRSILAVELAHRESRSSWRDFLLELRERGLTGVEFVVSDDHAGLRQAIVEVLPEAAAELSMMAELVDILNADVIALQEVDGPEAARLIFAPDQYDFHFSSRPDEQRTGFAIRRGVAFTPNPDLSELDVDGVRHGTDLTVMLDGQPVRLLSVHLKSFCHQDDLDNVSPISSTDCGKLKQQIPILEGWIEARAQEGVPLIVLGDFNRRFNIAGDDMWRELDDGDPDLTKHTEGLTSACMNFRFPEYIDHIVTDTRSTALVRPGSFEQVLFTKVDPGGQANLSDHCPIAVVFETEDVMPAAGDPMADILARLEAVQAELQAIQEAVGDLQP